VSWDHRSFYAELDEAVEDNDRTKVSELCDDLGSHLSSHFEPYGQDAALEVLDRLRRRRYFDELRRVADALVSNGCESFSIRRRYAQALLDTGMLSAAQHVLDRLVSETQAVFQDAEADFETRGKARKENAESRGLMGRLHKQRYIEARAPDIERSRTAMRQAILSYYDCYAEQESSREWHGINAVALAWRARRDGVPKAVHFDSLGVATEIRDRSKKKIASGQGDLWVAANAMEACLALDEYDEALGYAKQYVAPGNNADAFEIAGTLRNLRDVWLLPKEGKGAGLLTLLDARLRELEGISVTLEPGPRPSDAELEKVFSGTQVSFERYLEGLQRAAAVARIGPDAFSGIGTGFLVEGGALHEDWSGQPLLVTNWHVVPGGLSEGRATATFFGSEERAPLTYRVKERIWSSPVGELDTTILALDGDPAALPTCPLATRPPTAAADSRVLIIGHPGGGTMHFSLNDNRLLATKGELLHYRAPTQCGNSGSPVFDMDWRLVAVHHAGSSALPRLDGEGVYEANEGISIFEIVAAIARDRAAGRTP